MEQVYCNFSDVGFSDAGSSIKLIVLIRINI
jgi:hypothetical protein